MSKKIGRNDPCHCGSGKKYKKCCSELDEVAERASFADSKLSKTSKFIRKTNSEQILNFLVGLQLNPNNHGKNWRIEMLIHEVLSNLNSRPNGELSELYECLDEEYDQHYMEDPPENFFSDSVLFYGGHYTVFPGIGEQPVEILRNLLKSIFSTNNDLPESFKKAALDGAQLILSLGNYLANRFDLVGIINPEIDETEFEYFENQPSTSFKQIDIEGICKQYDVSLNTIQEFILKPDEYSQSFDDPNKNPLLQRPIVVIEGRYYFLLISNQVNALNEYILRMSNVHGCNESLISIYHNVQWDQLTRALKKVGWQLTDIAIPENAFEKNINEGVFRFDTSRLAYVCYFHNSVTGSGDERSSTKRAGLNIQDRVNEVISSLKSDSRLIDYQFLSLIVFDNVGKDMMVASGLPQDRELRLTFHIQSLTLLCYTEEWDQLDLWKFAKAYDKVNEHSSFLLSDTLDIYALYKAKGESFYLGDKKRPTHISLLPGEGEALLNDAKVFRDEHGIIAEHEKGLFYIPSIRYATYAPLYRPTEFIGYYAICLEFFKYPIWIVNYQVNNSIMAEQVGHFAQAIVFWLYKLGSEIEDQMNLFDSPCLMIELFFEADFFVDRVTSDIVQSTSDNDYIAELKDSGFKFKIPTSRLKDFIGSTNIGERDMMVKLLNSLNLVDGICLPVDLVKSHIDVAIPKGQAKMILLTDSTRFPLTVDKWLFAPFYIENSEIERILDELPIDIDKHIEIPSVINSDEEKVKLLNLVTTVLLEKLHEESRVFDCDDLMRKLIELNETLICERERNKTLLPAQILCFGKDDKNVKKARESEEKRPRTAIAVRCLVEYLAANPPKGNKLAARDEVDRLLALMIELTNYGLISDAIHFKMASPRIGKLESGRIGISKEFFEDALQPFRDASEQEQTDNYIDNFEQRFEISEQEVSEISQSDISDAEMEDKAFLADWNISYINIYKFCYSCYFLCLKHGASTISMEEEEFIQVLVRDFILPRDQVIECINRFSLQERDEYLVAPSGYRNNEVFPWKYNREFSFARRFLIRRTNSDGKLVLIWGARNSLSAFYQLESLLYQGRLNNAGVHIKSLLGIYGERNGKKYRNEVKDWLQGNTDFTVINHEVKISPKGHLKAGEDYGDIDVMAYDTVTKIVYSLECKDTVKAKNIHEMNTEMENYLGRNGKGGKIAKHIKRHEWITENKKVVAAFLNIEEPFDIVSIILTSEIIPTAYIRANDLPLPFVAFPNLKREGTSTLTANS